MIADYYPAERRATALGLYALGIPFGILFGFVAGGWLNEFFGWRTAFFVVGIPGLMLALVVRYTVVEPPRGLSEGRSHSGGQSSIGATFVYMWKMRAFRHLAIGGALTAFVGYGITSWMPSFLARSHGMSTGEIGTWLGIILGIPGGIGIVAGGWLADRLGARDPRWYMWIVAIALIVCVPLSIAVYLAPTAALALLFLCLPVALGNFYQATTFAQVQGLAPLRMRAVAAAVLLFILNFIGLGLGPTVTGNLSDLLAPTFGKESLRYALLICAFVNLWAGWHYWRAGHFLREDLAVTLAEDGRMPAS